MRTFSEDCAVPAQRSESVGVSLSCVVSPPSLTMDATDQPCTAFPFESVAGCADRSDSVASSTCLSPDVAPPSAVSSLPYAGSVPCCQSSDEAPPTHVTSPPGSPAHSCESPVSQGGPDSSSLRAPPPCALDLSTPDPAPQGLVIDPEELCVGKLLGRGGFGAVHLATYRGETVAVKSFSTQSQAADTYERELTALRCGLRHGNVAAVLGASCVDGWQSGACVVLQYGGSLNLQSLLLDPDYALTTDRVLSFSRQLTAGLLHLHSKRLIHLDVKPANCIVDTSDPCRPVLRISDFGLCCLEGAPWDSSSLGTVPFRAPELFRGSAPAFSSDVYSLAVLMWCLDARDLPYPDMAAFTIIFNVVQNRLRPRLPMTGDDDPLLLQFRRLYQDCWAADRAARPALDTVKEELADLHQRCPGTQRVAGQA